MAYARPMSSSVPERRILLVGKTGVGKSSLGNTILGKHVFETSMSLTSVTKTSQCMEATQAGRKVVVVDTPGFYDTDRTNMEISREIIRIFGYLSPGFHALVYVMGVERFTEECINTQKLFFKTFGEIVAKYTIIIITHYDRLKSEHVNVSTFLTGNGKAFLDFQKLCNNRVLMFNNKATGTEMETQLRSLFEIIETIYLQNSEKCYSNYHLKLIKAYMRLERKKRAININRARRELFKKAAENLGLKQVVVWDLERNRPSVEKAHVRILSHAHFSTKPVIKPIKKSKATKIKPAAVKRDVQSKAYVTVREVIDSATPATPKTKNTLSDRIDQVPVPDISIESDTVDATIVPDVSLDSDTVDGTIQNILDMVERGHEEDMMASSEEDTADRQIMNNRTFFDSLSDFFAELFRPILN